jgi:starch-binding outer membrane protein, SusD/RagB family
MDIHAHTSIARAGRLRLLAATIVAAATLVPLQGCDVNKTLLDAPDPDLVNPSDLQNPEGAEALRVGALSRWRDATGGDNANGDESTWLLGGLLADEWATASTFVQNDELDTRRVQVFNSSVTQGFRDLQRVRTAVNQAIPLMRQFRATETIKVAELFLARAQAESQLAQDFCSGLPLSNGAGEQIEWGDPLSTDSVFKVAVASYDSGLAIATGTATEAVRINRALRIGKARAVLALKRYAEAATLVAGIPTSYSYDHTFAASSGSNAIWGQATSGRRYNVGDNREGNARNIVVANNLDFFSANDPRVPSRYTITTTSSGKPDTTRSQDGNTLSRTTSIWGRETPVAVFNGTDARLIEAEAAYQAGDFAGMMAILNDLRAAPPPHGTVQPAPMTALTDPGTTDGRVDLLFREKAFWTFGRGQRLGDMRRLIRDYGRRPDNTFPEGVHYRGGTYGTDVNLPVPQQEENNPNFTRAACDQTKA